MRLPREQAMGIAGLGTGGLIVALMLPYATDARVDAEPLGVLAVLAGFGSLAVMLAVAAALTGSRHLVAARLEAAALWAGCGLAVLLAVGAIATSAQTLDLRDVVLAQRNTAIYAFRQPVAAAIYATALALAWQESALHAVLGPRTGERMVAQVLVVAALAGTGATLFLGGSAGERLAEPAWLALKTAGYALVLLLVRWRLEGLADGARLALAWLVAGAALLNLMGTFVMVGR